VETLFSRLAGTAALLAEDAPAGGGAAKPGDGLLSLLIPIIPIVVLFYFMIMRPQRREQARRQTMLEAVQKNDRIVTAGGIYGVVTNVHREADEVTIKVDEATNTKLRVTLSSIARVLGDESSEPSGNK